MTLPRGVFGIFRKFWISTEISYFCIWKNNFRKIHRVYTYQTTFGHRFHLLLFIFHQPTLAHGFLTSLPRGVFEIFWKFWILTEILYFPHWKKDLGIYSRVHAYQANFGHRFEVLPFISRQQNLVHGFLTPFPEGCLEFFGNFEFRLKYRISAFKKNLE